MARSKTQRFTVGEYALNVSNLDKVLYPATGTTKADVIHYYLTAADALIAQAAWRPVTRKRWVNGVGTADSPGQVFFRKDIEDGAPDWVPTGRIAHKDHTNTYPLANNAAVLAWFAQLAALEIHVPQWRFGVDGAPRNPDRLVIDLDPGPGAGLAECVEVAHAVREILSGMNLSPVPVTSGSKGIHLYAPLDGATTSEQASAVAKKLALALQGDLPDLVVALQQKMLRDGKVLVDWSQNNAAKTTVCPYSLRGRQFPMVAAPRTWEELDAPNLSQLRYEEVLERLADGIDPIAGQGWTFDQAPGASDKLTRYRAKRDAAKTPEPVPAEGIGSKGSDAPTFVVQEHHARRLHWDFRLEHDGVLVSWAVPNGPPLKVGERALAVQTEDHPLGYGSFEGVIPKGEYGGGTVTIWDAGTIEVEKWRDDEIIAVLRGGQTGGLGGAARRYVLIRTEGEGEKSHWLLMLKKDQPDDDAPADGSAPQGEPDAVPEAAVPEAADLPEPMLATAGTPVDLDDGEEWALEMKWDGVRAICAVAGGKVRLVSRSGSDMTELYPELAGLPDALGADAAILDGEIVALDEDGRPDFSLLQPRMKANARTAPKLAHTTPVTLMLFDVLALTVEGAERRLMRTPYSKRREVLHAAVTETETIRVPPAFDGDLAAAQAHARDNRLEGVLAKRSDSVYTPGRRSHQWVKLKDRAHQSVVVIGWRVADDGGLRSLLVAIPGEDGLTYVGRVGSGIPAGQRADIERTLQRIERKTPPVEGIPRSESRDARWVTPKLVGEVALADVTRTGRLRQPSWRGWRPDLSPKDVRWEI